MVSKIKGGDPQNARIFGLEVLKYFLDGVIEGKLTEEDIFKLKVKTPKISEKGKINKCEKCEKLFPTDQGLKIHASRTHTERKENHCDICRITLKSAEDFKTYMKLEHEEIFSPQAKKGKRSSDEEVLKEETDNMAEDNDLKVLEEKSWE